MSGIFTITASVVALGASVVSGPLGSIDARPALQLHDTADRGEIAVAYRDGELAGIMGKPSPSMAYGDFPPVFFKALEAAEDGSFEQHMGVDPAGIARAGLDLVHGASSGVGGSTLTQQLTKNVVTGSSRSISRKLADMISAVETESVASKKEILESYANAVYFGRGSHGAKDAARNWFGKDWHQLDIGEIAFIAGIVKAPSALDPLKHPKEALARRNYVLERMADDGIITEGKEKAAEAEPLDVIAPQASTGADAAMSDADFWALSYARRRYHRAKAGKSATSVPAAGEAMSLSLDNKAQDIAQDDLREGLRKLRSVVPDRPLGSVLDKGLTDLSDSDAVADAARAITPGLPKGARRVVVVGKPTGSAGLRLVDGDAGSHNDGLGHIAVPGNASVGDVYVLLPGAKSLVGRPRVQGAAVVVDLTTGRTIASVGGLYNWASQFDRTQARRQPGSAVKPFLYLAALRQNYSPTEMISDAPVSLDSENFDGPDVWSPDNYGGEGTSGSIPLYRGLEKSLNRVAARLVKQIGSRPFKDVLEQAGAYPRGDDKLLLPSAVLGTVETTPERMARAMAALNWRTSLTFDPSLLNEIDRMMRGVVVRGTAAHAFRNGPDGVIGKTGTSQQDRDAWFIGLTGDIALAVWIGRDDDQPLPSVHGRSSTGGAVAAPVVANIIRDLRKVKLSSAKIELTPYGSGDVAGAYGYGQDTASSNHSSDWFPPAPGGGTGRGDNIYAGSSRDGPASGDLPPANGVGLY